jgi:hypothetical protein
MAKREKTSRGTKQPTARQLGLVKHLLDGATITEAARRAGYSQKWPGQAGYQALQNLRLKMPELLDRLGLTDAALIETHLKPLLRAQTTKFFQHQGKVKDKRVVAAYEVRLHALDMAFRLRGSYAPPKEPEVADKIGVKVVLVGVPRPGKPMSRTNDPIQAFTASGNSPRVTSSMGDRR